MRISNVCPFCLLKFFLAMTVAANGTFGDCKLGGKGAAYAFVARTEKIVYDTRDEKRKEGEYAVNQ